MPLSFVQHAVHPWFENRDDELVIAGQPLTDIAARVGRTPFYVYDRSVMTRKAQALRQLLPRAVHIHYAIKANPMPDVVQHMRGLVDGLDVASAGEMQVALATGIAAELISFAGPGKTASELERAAAAGVVVNVESEREVNILARLAESLARRPKVAVRVNPDFELKTSGMKMGGGPKQFGIDAEQVPSVLQRMRSLPLDFQGFHIFSGSQNLQAHSIIEAQRKSVELGIRLAEFAPQPLRTLNIGGGFGIAYFPGEQPLEVPPIAAELVKLVELCEQQLPGARLVLELGRYLVGESGVYVCRVIDRKISRGQVFLVTDGGLHHHLAASGNFGQVLRKNYPALIGNRVHGAQREKASIVGPLCTPLDLLADRMEMAKADAGDLAVVLQSGAYGLTASPLGFLSHPAPAEILL
ncbi:MAG: pyridoxal-dependent decarboxylase, exosortase A system-associated [Steroidobacteraceae bacterium]